MCMPFLWRNPYVKGSQAPVPNSTSWVGLVKQNELLVERTRLGAAPFQSGDLGRETLSSWDLNVFPVFVK